MKILGIFWSIVLIATILNCPICASEWKGLAVSGKMVEGGYDVWGRASDYSLLIRFENRGSKSVKIRMHEIYNASLNISFQNLESNKALEHKPGRTGDVIPKDRADEGESISIGPGSFVNITIGLDAFEKFHPGNYKGKHQLFGLEISEFEITKSGRVINKVEKEGVR